MAKRSNLSGNSTTDRGYGNAHQRLRREWKPKVERGEVVCWRCKRLIQPGAKWDLGHAADRSMYRGPEHMECNRATSAHKAKHYVEPAVRLVRPRNPSRSW